MLQIKGGNYEPGERSVNKYPQLVKTKNPAPAASRIRSKKPRGSCPLRNHDDTPLMTDRKMTLLYPGAPALMPKTFPVLMLLALLSGQTAHAQAYLKSTWMGRSKYDDMNSNDTNAKGSAYVVRAGFQLPVSMKADTMIRGTDTIPVQTVWMVRGDVSYSRFDNRGMEVYQFPDQVQNYRAGVIYLHTLSKKWSLYSTLGAGLYTASSGVYSSQIIGEGALIFIRTITPNLKAGAGVAFDNTFGFPMAYPGLIVDWTIDGKGGKYFARLNSNELKAGIRYSDKFQLYANFDAFGASALAKDKMFTHLYYAAGITPEFKAGKYFTIPITIGMTFSRRMYSNDRTLTNFLSYMTKDSTPHFGPSPYVSVGINYGM